MSEVVEELVKVLKEGDNMKKEAIEVSDGEKPLPMDASKDVKNPSGNPAEVKKEDGELDMDKGKEIDSVEDTQKEEIEVSDGETPLPNEASKDVKNPSGNPAEVKKEDGELDMDKGKEIDSVEDTQKEADEEDSMKEADEEDSMKEQDEEDSMSEEMGDEEKPFEEQYEDDMGKMTELLEQMNDRITKLEAALQDGDSMKEAEDEEVEPPMTESALLHKAFKESFDSEEKDKKFGKTVKSVLY